jgi:hypothetical protein
MTVVPFSIDLTSSSISLNAIETVVPSTAPALYVRCAMVDLFPSGVMFTGSWDASGLFRYTGLANANSISVDHFKARAAGYSGWWNAAQAGGTFELAYEYNNSSTNFNTRIVYNTYNGRAQVGPGMNLGRHIVHLVTKALNTADPEAETAVFGDGFIGAASEAIAAQIGAAIKAALATADAQKAIFDCLIRSNGPFFLLPNMSPNSTLPAMIPMHAAMNDLFLSINISKLAFEVDPGGLTGGGSQTRHKVTLSDIPPLLLWARNPKTLTVSTAAVTTHNPYTFVTVNPNDQTIMALANIFSFPKGFSGLGYVVNAILFKSYSEYSFGTWRVYASNTAEPGTWELIRDQNVPVTTTVNVTYADSFPNYTPYLYYAVAFMGFNANAPGPAGPLSYGIGYSVLWSN